MDYKRLGDLYQLLGIDPRADEELISAAYKIQMKKAHPDKNGGSHDLTVKLNMAKEILLNKDNRQEYDIANERLLGNYRIIRQIGEGAFGRTYEANHVILEEKACLKQNINITPIESELMTKEAKVLWNLHHYSLPTLRDFFRCPDGSVVLAMSFVEGDNLEKVIEKHKQIKSESACWIMQRLLNALNYLHYHGIIHGDIKPENIIVQPDEHNALLVDYGFSTIHPHKNSKAEGYTPAFVAPELLAGKPPTPESDIYALGCSMIYTLGGDPIAKTHGKDTPKKLRGYLDKLVLHDSHQRPIWENTDLVRELSDIRMEVFGRRESLKK